MIILPYFFEKSKGFEIFFDTVGKTREGLTSRAFLFLVLRVGVLSFVGSRSGKIGFGF